MNLAVRALAALLLFGAAPALADDDDAPSIGDIPHITIVGSAHVETAPDIATITLGVTTEKPNAGDAAEENARKAQAVIDAAKAQGIAAADIATQSLTLTQTFDELRSPDGRHLGQRPRGFAAENIVTIQIRDLAKAGALAGALIAKGANRLDGIAFGVANPEPIRIKATGEAVRNAKDLAQAAADAAGVRLGRVLLVREPGSGVPMRAETLRMKRAAPAAAPMPIEAGTTSYAAAMEVTWALEKN